MKKDSKYWNLLIGELALLCRNFPNQSVSFYYDKILDMTDKFPFPGPCPNDIKYALRFVK